MATTSTKLKLLSLIEDVEIVTKELFDVMCTPKSQRSEQFEVEQLIELLVQKDKELQTNIETAKEQGELQQKLDALKSEVEKRDVDIKQLQRNLKEAESVLATAIFQARQKLKSINKANSRKISSEELIKYAHMISSTNAVAAPATWAPGDPRRPYPTDMDMLRSDLAKSGTAPSTLQSQNTLQETTLSNRNPQLERTLSHPSSTLSWQSSLGELNNTSLPSQHTTGHPHPPAIRDTEDVEIMTSDSSSSSSSDE